MTRAELNIAWCEAHLHLPEGRYVGQPLAMAEFMQDDFKAIYDNPALTIVISTQAPDDQDLLSILIDDALAGHDPTTVLRLNTAPDDADPFDEQTVRLANPAYDVFMNTREVMSMASDAKRMPAREAAFRNLVLNQRVEAEEPFLAAAQWNACSGAPTDLEGREVYGGSICRASAILLRWF